jgi:hypothetical protein
VTVTVERAQLQLCHTATKASVDNPPDAAINLRRSAIGRSTERGVSGDRKA